MVAVITELTHARREAGRRTLAAKRQGPESSLSRGHLLRSLILYSNSKNKSGNIILAIILAAAFLITGSAIILRSQGSYLGSFFSSESKESREAALYGQKVIISEMARTPNRRMLLAQNSTAAGGWVYPSSWTDATRNQSLRNPCAQLESQQTSRIKLPTNIPGATDSAKASVGIQAEKRYWLRSVEFKNQTISGTRNYVKFTRDDVDSPWRVPLNGASNPAYSALDINLNGEKRAYVALEVQGESVQNGKTSISRINKEYEVIPKCCGLSFGNTYANSSSPELSFGQDARLCLASGTGLLGLVTGANKDGIFDINGQSFALYDGSLGNYLLQASTLNPSDAKTLTSSTGNTDLILPNQTLPPQITAPSEVSFENSGCITTGVTLPADGEAGTGGCTSGSASSQRIYQENGNATPNYVGQGRNRVLSSYSGCRAGEFSVSPNTAPPVPVGGILTDRRQADLPSQVPSPDKCYLDTSRTVNVALPYCEPNPIDPNNYYCRIRYIDTGSVITIDTSGSKTVTLLLTDATATGSILGGSVSFTGGSGGFAHRSDLGNPAPIEDAFRFRVVSDVVGSNIQLKASSAALSGLFDLRYSNVELRGGGVSASNLNGILWVNNLTLTGSIQVLIPSLSYCAEDSVPPAGTLCALLRSLYPSLFDGEVNASNFDYDFTPRSVFSLNMFQ